MPSAAMAHVGETQVTDFVQIGSVFLSASASLGRAPDPGFAPGALSSGWRAPTRVLYCVHRFRWQLTRTASANGFVTWSQRTPDRGVLAEREAGGGWRRITYAQALQRARALGAAFLARGLSSEHPLVILSDNSVDHALLALGAQLVGVSLCTDFPGVFADVERPMPSCARLFRCCTGAGLR